MKDRRSKKSPADKTHEFSRLFDDAFRTGGQRRIFVRYFETSDPNCVGRLAILARVKR
jgi:hypothetical protein